MRQVVAIADVHIVHHINGVVNRTEVARGRKIKKRKNGDLFTKDCNIYEKVMPVGGAYYQNIFHHRISDEDGD
ncbi:MAG: hypothetical protein ACEQSB_00610 [Undibacterium sp.]